MPPPPTIVSEESAARRPYRLSLVALAASAVIAVLLLLTTYNVVTLLLVAFGGILLGVLLRSLADLAGWATGLGHGWSLAIVLVVLVGLIALGCWLMAGRLAHQFSQLAVALPKSISSLHQQMKRHELTRFLLSTAPSGGAAPAASDLISTTFGVVSTTFEVVAGIVVILIAGIYLAAEPKTYIHGLMLLIPPRGRQRGRQVLEALEHTLRWWVAGQAMTMLVIGAMAIVGLWLIGMPLAIALGILTGLLNFIPTLGPMISFVPVVLLALAIGPAQALWVIVLFVIIHTVEGYLVTPLIQRRTVWLPPALTVVVQIVMGWLVGVVGVIFAAPLTAVSIVLVKMLYIEDQLGDRGSAAAPPSPAGPVDPSGPQINVTA